MTISLNVYNDCPVICEGWHSIHIWKAYAWPHSFTKKECLDPSNYFNPATFYWSSCTKIIKWAVMYLCVRISILPISTIYILNFGTVTTVWYFFHSFYYLYNMNQRVSECGLLFNVKFPAISWQEKVNFQ